MEPPEYKAGVIHNEILTDLCGIKTEDNSHPLGTFTIKMYEQGHIFKLSEAFYQYVREINVIAVEVSSGILCNMI
jgi:hypothetical protein